jgi:hypothetical protein
MNEVCQYYGKYRGTVVNNIDPEQRGRLLVTVPDVLGVNLSSWAMPCLPMAGSNMGISRCRSLALASGSNLSRATRNTRSGLAVLGDSGGGAAGAKRPDSARDHPANGHPERYCDQRRPRQQGHSIQIASGAAITITDAGIFLTNGQGAMLSLSGKTVDINGGALTIT